MIPEKRLGQHFLSDPGILGKIVDALDPAPEDVVIEIGPGKGSLTAILAPRVRSVIAIEKDRRLADGLGTGGSGLGELRVVSGDALRLDWHALLPSPKPLAPSPSFKIVGNIPYSITSPLIEKALTPPLPDSIAPTACAGSRGSWRRSTGKVRAISRAAFRSFLANRRPRIEEDFET